jgi:hypothetical protein
LFAETLIVRTWKENTFDRSVPPMRAIAELASSLIAGVGTVAARASVELAPPDTLIAALANNPAGSAAVLFQ